MPEGKGYKSLVTADESVIKPVEATDFVTEKMALAAKKAWENRQEAGARSPSGKAVVVRLIPSPTTMRVPPCGRVTASVRIPPTLAWLTPKLELLDSYSKTRLNYLPSSDE